jgi:hypothetical protein
MKFFEENCKLQFLDHKENEIVTEEPKIIPITGQNKLTAAYKSNGTFKTTRHMLHYVPREKRSRGRHMRWRETIRCH